MAFIPTPNVALVEMVHLCSGETCVNTLSFENTTGWDVAKLGLLASSMKTWWDDNVKSRVHGNCSLQLIRATSQATQVSPGIEYTTGLPITGTGTASSGDSLPNNVTAAISFLTLMRGRSYRGRNYVIGLRTQDISGNEITSTARAAWEAAYEEINTDAYAGSIHVVVSKQVSGVARAEGVATTITGYRMDLSIDSQRRRLQGRGQ